MTASANTDQPQHGSGSARKAIIVWTVVMLSVLCVTWLAVAIAWPAWQVGTVLRRQPEGEKSVAEWVEYLGGPDVAPGKIRTYARLATVNYAQGECLADMLETCGSGATPVLMELVERGYVRKLYALKVLKYGMAEHPSSFPLLEEMLGRKDDKVARSWTADALQYPKNYRAVELLLRATKDPEEDVRYQAFWSLGEHKDHAHEIIPVLKKMAERGDPYTSTVARQSLLILQGRRTRESFYTKSQGTCGSR